MMPIFTTLGAWLFLGQRFSAKFLLGLAVAIGGVLAIGVQDFPVTGNQSGQQLWGDAAALLAAILLAITLLSVERLRDRFSTPLIMMGMSLTGSLTILPVLCWSQQPMFPTSWTSGLAVLGLALISQVTGHGLLTYSLKRFPFGLVSMSMLAIPMLSTVLAMILFAQPLSLLNGTAFLIVLLGIYLAISAPKCSQDFKLQPELPTKV
jgi:drug/metabolite transporter (DMT)-like permease